MKILIIGGTGTIGKEVVQLLDQEHEVIAVGNTKGEHTVDISNKDSIEKLFKNVGQVDAIFNISGQGEFGKFDDKNNTGYELSWNNKVMGQVNLVRIGLDYLKTGGSITLTSGSSAKNPNPGTASISMACAAIDTFVATAALEISDDRKINVVSPGFVKETMELLGMDSSTGIPAKEVATYYQKSLEANTNGQVFDAILGA